VEPETGALRAFQTAVAEAELALARRMSVTPRDMTAMGHIFFAPEPIGPRELSDRLGLTPAGSGDLVDRLERSGHVRRRPHDTDGRRVVLEASDRARADVLGHLGALLAAVDAIASGYDATERAAIRRFLAEATGAYRAFAEGDQSPS